MSSETIKIINIINQNYNVNYEEIMLSIMNDNILNKYSKIILIKYFENKYTHPTTFITFEKFFSYLWVLINTLDNRKNIKY